MRNYIPTPSPLGNRYDRTRQYHNSTGPGPAAGLYTSNPNGSQAIRRRQPAKNYIPMPANMQPQQPVHNYLAGMPGDTPQVQYTVDRQDAQGNFTPVYGSPFPVNPNASPAVPMPTYGTPEVHPYGTKVNLSAQQNHQARQDRVAAGNGRGQNLRIPEAALTPSFMHHAAEMDRQYQQQMAAANGSQGYQQGQNSASEIPELANMYRQTALNRYRNGSTGGANMIERAQQLSKSMLAPDAIMPGGINAQIQAESSARNFQAQRDYLSDPGYQNSQALLARNHTGDGSVGENGLYTLQRADGKYALTSRANAAQGVRAEEVGPLTGRGGQMFVDIHGNETSENDPEGYAINERTNPAYWESAAKNQARIRENRAARGGISDRQERQLGHLERSLNRAVAGGGMTQQKAAQRLAKEKEAIISRPTQKDYLDFSNEGIGKDNRKLPDGNFDTPTRAIGQAELKSLTEPQTPQDIEANDMLNSLGINAESSSEDVETALLDPRNLEYLKSNPEQKSKMARALARKIRAEFFAGGDDWFKHSNDWGLYSGSSGAAFRDAAKKATNLTSTDNLKEVTDWLDAWMKSHAEEQAKHQAQVRAYAGRGY